MNILQFLKYVNPQTEDSQIYDDALKAGCCEFLYSISSDKSLFELCESEHGFCYHRPKVETTVGIQSRCTFNVPTIFAETPKAKKKEKRKRKDKKLLYPQIFEYCQNGGDFRVILFGTLQKFLKTWIYICSWIEGKYRAFLCNAKGTPAYCLKKYWQIHDFCKACDDYYTQKYFLTLTMAQKEYGTNLQLAWERFNEEVSKFNKAFQKHFNGDYACALEAHKSGFPHAHIVLYHNEKIENPKEKYDKFKKTVCLCDGVMFDWVNAHWTMGINVLKVNHRKNTYDYLAKYISKATQVSLRDYTIRDMNDDSILKEVATMLLPMVFGVREFKMSQGRFNKEESSELEIGTEFSTAEEKSVEQKEEEDFELNGEEREALLALLKKLCTKLPPKCMKKCYQKSFLDFQKLKPLNPEDLQKLPIHRNIQIAESGKKLSCNGCIYSKILDFICHGDMELFSVSKNWDLIGSFINWHYSQPKDKSLGLSGETKEEEYKKFVKAEGVRNRLFQFPNANKFSQMFFADLKGLVCKDFSDEELHQFFIASYTVNPMIARFVLPKKWADIIEFYNSTKEEYRKCLAPEEKQFLKEMCSQIHLGLTNSASGIIITENN